MFYNITEQKMKNDFRYIKDEYSNRNAAEFKGFRKAKKDRNDLRGKVCAGCGLVRSMMNKCDCNS